MRVGINTGQVPAGYVGARGEYTVLGDTVNIAGRLETTAEPGTVVISDSTYRLVRGLFRLIPHKHRRQYHLAVARWLQRYGTADFAAMVGEHLEQAGVFIEAAENFEVAAAHARKCGAVGEAQWLENHANEIRNFPAGTRPLGRTGSLPNLS